MPSILTGWWRAAEAVARLISSPRTNVARADAAAAGVFGRSALVVAASRALTALTGAWHASVTRRIVVRAGDAIPNTAVLRTRFAAVAVVVASLTVLALQALKPGPREPLAWLLPAMAIASALLVAVAGAARGVAPRERNR
ncbi:MAG: hypothetical protein JWL71_4129 [Acidobacteria bacterium]|nr:hypothetical protein [Acidobacteriota bacterium]